VTAETLTAQTLGQYLQSRRAKVSPADVGLFQGRRRRVQGLRREELAGLAGLSTAYYARLEQGRHSHPSPGVLDAVADVLRLSPAERDYLRTLARPAEKPAGGQEFPAETVRPETLRVMRALGTTPAFLVGPRLDILATNGAARRLYADFDAMPAGKRNGVRWMLSSPHAQALHGDEWAAITAELIGMLRLRFGRQPRDDAARRLVAELSAESEFFRRVWADLTVSRGSRPVKRFHHPEGGTIDVAVEVLDVAHACDQQLVVLVPAPGSADDRAWRDVMGRTDPGVTAITDMTGCG